MEILEIKIIPERKNCSDRLFCIWDTAEERVNLKIGQ